MFIIVCVLVSLCSCCKKYFVLVLVVSPLRGSLPPKATSKLSEFDLKVRRAAYLEIDHMLRDDASEAFPEDATSWCLTCNKQCRVWPSVEELQDFRPSTAHQGSTSSDAPLPLLMNGAGSTCIGWTCAGTRIADAHPAMLPFTVWKNERVERLEDIVWHENSKAFDAGGQLEQPMAASHEGHTICLAAEDVGLPWARVRSLSFLWKKSTLIWVGDQSSAVADFMEAFKCRPELSGDAYLIDDEHASEETRARCAAKGFHHPENVDSNYWCDVPDAHHLTPSQSLHKEAYMQLAAKKEYHPSKAFLMDLGQNPSADRPSCGGFVPRMITHGLLASQVKRRCFTKLECFYPTGVPRDGGWYSELISKLGTTDVMRLVGNGMCMPPSAAWLFFNLCHLVRRDVAETRQARSMLQQPHLSQGSLPSGDESDQGSDASCEFGGPSSAIGQDRGDDFRLKALDPAVKKALVELRAKISRRTPFTFQSSQLALPSQPHAPMSWFALAGVCGLVFDVASCRVVSRQIWLAVCL